MEIYISESVANKLREKHSVSEQEVLECFKNAQPTFILDDRPEHRTTRLQSGSLHTQITGVY